MANLDLSKYGITGVTEILHNPSYDVLFAEETKPSLEGFEKGQVTELGAVNVMTGIYTGRSPKDKFFVKNEASADSVWWTSEEYKNDNKPCTEEAWADLKAKAVKQLSGKRLFVVDTFCGANEATRMKVRFIMEVAWQAHFVTNMFIRPTAEELASYGEPDFVCFNASKAKVDNYKELGLNSETATVFNLKTKEQVILNTWYGGEMKKGMFSIMNYMNPRVHIVHDREHAFLHFTTIPSIQDNLFFSLQIENSSSFRVQTKLFVVVNFCFRSVETYKIRFSIASKFFCSRTDKHVSYEVSLPSYFHDETYFHTSSFVSTTESINNEQTFAGKLFYSFSFQVSPSFFSTWFVIVFIFFGSPPYRISRSFILNEEFIFRRTTGIDTCHHVHSA